VSIVRDALGSALIAVSAAAIAQQFVILRPAGWRVVASKRGRMLRLLLVSLLSGVFVVAYSGRPSAIGGWLLIAAVPVIWAWDIALLLRGRIRAMPLL
jgi:hypothetical protein